MEGVADPRGKFANGSVTVPIPGCCVGKPRR